MVTNVLLVELRMNNGTKCIVYTVCTVCMAILAGLIIRGLIYVVFIKSDNTIPSEEQKQPKVQVSTEVNTHVIRCTAYVNDTCTEYKVYSVIKE